MKVGDKIWIFDYNHRVYEKDGIKYNSPIYSEYFRQAIIEEETARSWVVWRIKYPKSSPRGLYTDEQKSEKIWDNEHRRKIINIIESIEPVKLREIAKLIGYVK